MKTRGDELQRGAGGQGELVTGQLKVEVRFKARCKAGQKLAEAHSDERYTRNHVPAERGQL